MMFRRCHSSIWTTLLSTAPRPTRAGHRSVRSVVRRDPRARPPQAECRRGPALDRRPTVTACVVPPRSCAEFWCSRARCAGDEWGTGWVFPKPSCCTIDAIRDPRPGHGPLGSPRRERVI